jgi:hypothetical protein
MLLNKHNLQIAELASKDPSRFTLDVLSVTKERTAVTNGHYLVTVTLPGMADADFPAIEGFTPSNGATPEFLLNRETALEVAKAIPNKITIPVLRHASVGVSDDAVSLAVTNIDSPKVFRSRKEEGQFPNIDVVIPDSKDTTLTIAFSAEYLMKLCKSALAVCDDRNATIKLEFRDPAHAVKMTAHNSDTGQDWMAVLMPKRV